MQATRPDSAASLWLCNRQPTSLINSVTATACRCSELPTYAWKQNNILNVLDIRIIYWIDRVIFIDLLVIFSKFLLYSFLWQHVLSSCFDQLAPGRRVWPPVTSAFLPLPLSRTLLSSAVSLPNPSQRFIIWPYRAHSLWFIFPLLLLFLLHPCLLVIVDCPFQFVPAASSTHRRPHTNKHTHKLWIFVFL